MHGLHNTKSRNRGQSAAGEERILRRVAPKNDRGSFARCTLRAVDDRLYDRCYVNHVIFNSQLSIVNFQL